MEKLNISLLQPAGNDTALVEGFVTKKQKRIISKRIMEDFPNVEQVGFYKVDNGKNIATLEMAGGEFCGNATRAFAYLLLGGKKGNIKIKSSGVKNLLNSGVLSQGISFSSMPIYSSFKKVIQLKKNIFRVDLQGISHLIYTEPCNLNPQQLKVFGKSLLEKYDMLHTLPAAGVMFISEDHKKLTIKPIVWVRDIETLFYETACASGTTALGLYLAKQSSSFINTYSVTQPSGENLTITIKKTFKKFMSASISGPVRILSKKKITV